MGQDRILAVDDRGVVPPLVEHAHVDAQHVGDVDRPAHAALVGADDHQVSAVDGQIRIAAEDVLDELVGGADGLKARHRHRVLHARVVGVEGDDIGDAEVLELLQHAGAVHGFAAVPLDLPSLVEVGHDHVDPAALAARSRDDPLQIHEMIVRGHDIFKAVHDQRPESVLMLVGVGDLMPMIKQKVETLGLNESVIFAGLRSDVHKMMSAFDIFLFPSLYEGLPVTLVEAQTSSLPVVCSDVITKEIFVTDLIEKLPLSQSAAAWGDYVVQKLDVINRHDRENNTSEMFFYDINESSIWLESYYKKIMEKN